MKFSDRVQRAARREAAAEAGEKVAKIAGRISNEKEVKEVLQRFEVGVRVACGIAAPGSELFGDAQPSSESGSPTSPVEPSCGKAGPVRPTDSSRQPEAFLRPRPSSQAASYPVLPDQPPQYHVPYPQTSSSPSGPSREPIFRRTPTKAGSHPKSAQPTSSTRIVKEEAPFVDISIPQAEWGAKTTGNPVYHAIEPPEAAGAWVSSWSRLYAIFGRELKGEGESSVRQAVVDCSGDGTRFVRVRSSRIRFTS